MPPKSRLKVVRSLDDKTTPDLTFSPQNRHAPNRPSDVRYNGVQKNCRENRGKHFSIQFDGQQIHVEEGRSSILVAQGNVQSNRPHLAQSNGSMHCNTLTGFPDFVSKKRRTIQHPRTLGTIVNGAEDVQPTQDPSGTTDCPHQLSDGVQEGNFENIHENNSMHSGTSTTTTSKVKRTRGPLSKSACKPPNGQKWKCMFIHRQPVGVEASKLAEVLGLYARNDNYFSPYKDWREQSKQSLNDVMKELLVEYDFVDEEGMPANMAEVTKFCEYSISNKVKEWRATLKKAGYMKGVNGELSEAPPNERVSPGTWDLLMQYWKNPKKLQETERNKKNRTEDQATHTLGAKSIARHHHEQREKLGDNYSTVGAYVKAHQTKNGEYPNEYTRAICEKVIATCEERNLTNSSEPSVLTPVLDAIYNGHHGGFERGCGLGWSRAAWSHNIANEARNDNIRRLTVDLENTQSKLQNAMAEIQDMRTREREMEARQQEYMEAMHAREKELEVRQQEQEEAMLAREREMQKRLAHMEAMVSMSLPNASVGDYRFRSGTSRSHPPI